MDVKYIEQQISISKSEKEMLSIWVFSNSQMGYLFQPEYGVSMLVSREVLDQILSSNISDELKQKLKQRGFFNIKSSENNSFNKPFFFMIDLTQECQNRCLYCFRKLNQTKHIEKAKLLSILNYIINYCSSNNIKQISIQPWGGEPLLEWENIKMMQDHLIQNGITPKIIIETNGIAITSKMATELFQRNISISVSIDGPENIHNTHRPLYSNKPSFKQTINGYQLLQKAGYGNRIGVVCVITKKSLPDINQILDFFISDLHLTRIKMNIVKDNKQIFNKDLILNEEDILQFEDKLCKVILKINQDGISFGESGFVERLHNLLDRKITNLCSSRGCQAPQRMFSFSMDGNIYPCDQIDTQPYMLGNINQDLQLTDLIRNQTKNIFYHTQNLNECQNCPWLYFCKGGCTAMRLLKKSNIDKTECIRNRIIYPQLIELILNHPNTIASITNQEIIIS